MIAAGLLASASTAGMPADQVVRHGVAAKALSTYEIVSQADEPSPLDRPVPLGEGLIWGRLGDSFRPDTQAQVRIERRVIIRINPSRAYSREGASTSSPEPVRISRFRERPMGRCVPIREISGVQALRENRLLFLMRDRQIVSAALQKGCRARDFYSGFYVERSHDGLICSRRDFLQSRAGAKCEVNRLRRFIPIDD